MRRKPAIKAIASSATNRPYTRIENFIEDATYES
jgi:hypothetical protein